MISKLSSQNATEVSKRLYTHSICPSKLLRKNEERLSIHWIYTSSSLYSQIKEVINQRGYHECWYRTQDRQNEDQGLVVGNQPQLQIDEHNHIMDHEGAVTEEIHGVWCQRYSVVGPPHNVSEVVDYQRVINGQRGPANEIFPGESFIPSVRLYNAGSLNSLDSGYTFSVSERNRIGSEVYITL